MQNTSLTTVSAYIAAAPKDVRGKLKQMRAIVKALAPGAEEKISYGMPAYKLRGRVLVYFAAFKNHIGFYPGSGTVLKVYAPDLRRYKTSKGTVQFPLERPLPVALIRKLIRAKIKLNEGVSRT
ncbi:MAG: DUF1801 domain-containing protein [Chloroflexi bacterium]|nr:DUF1801 domain-containing protein [Chloroflexota bacterium]